MNEVDRQVAELQAEKENKKQEYSVEVESAEPPSATDETEIEIPEKKKTFETEVVKKKNNQQQVRQSLKRKKLTLKKSQNKSTAKMFKRDLMSMLIN